MENIVKENDGYRVDQLSIQVPEVVKDDDLGREPFLINAHLFVEFTIVAVKVARPHVLLRSVGRVDPVVDGLMLFRPPHVIVALARDAAGGKLLATKVPGILLRSRRILHRVLSVNNCIINGIIRSDEREAFLCLGAISLTTSSILLLHAWVNFLGVQFGSTFVLPKGN